MNNDKLIFRQLFDSASCTYTYLLGDLLSREAILIDPVLEQVTRDIGLLADLQLSLRYTVDTHIHADHITAASRLKEKLGSEILMPASSDVQGADKHINDTDEIAVGNIQLRALHTPGHTREHMAYFCAPNMLFSGDALFIRGCGRTDFQGGDPNTLFDSITQKIFPLGASVKVFPGHEYRGISHSTIAEEIRCNPRLNMQSKAEFVAIMEGLNLPHPKRIDEAVPANLLCGNI